MEETVAIEGSKLLGFWSQHYIYSPAAENLIDWAAISWAREKMSFQQKRWSSKLAAEFIPTGAIMEDRGRWDHSKCPQN
eukprot:15324552-Ditylum_brightwellii.AAC.1